MPSDVEQELNKYPINGFKFEVSHLNELTLLGGSVPIRVMEIQPKFIPDSTDSVEMVGWFYLALTDYAEKSRGRVTITIDYNQTLTMKAHLETNTN